MEKYQKICFEIIPFLSPKPREIIFRRFGLLPNQSPQTLQEIGAHFGITRERVRQIENEALNRLRENIKANKAIASIFSDFEKYLAKNGGLKREGLLLQELGGKGLENYVFFLLTLDKGLFRFSQSKEFFAFWSKEKGISKKVSLLLKNLFVCFKGTKKSLVKDDVYKFFAKETKKFVDSLIEIGKAVDQGPLGEVGLTIWPEIKPRGVRDVAYLVLKKKAKPMHFQEIAQAANDFRPALLRKRKVLPQTVHNELIKDTQFILVGRGLYCLKEWGYEQGTVKDVINDILKKSVNPMSRQEILSEVLKRRIVQPNTIFLNLNNKKYFQKDTQGKYCLKEA